MTLFEKSDRIGGLLRYGIPDFKLEKHQIDRRISQMEAEGVEFAPSTYIGNPSDAAADLTVRTPESLMTRRRRHDRRLRNPRDLPVPGRELSGVYYAMDFLRQQNKASDQPDAGQGQACGDRRRRHGLRLRAPATATARPRSPVRLPQPPESENKRLLALLPLRTSSSHEEAASATGP